MAFCGCARRHKGGAGEGKVPWPGKRTRDVEMEVV